MFGPVVRLTRPSASQRGYGAAYKRARAAILAGNPTCHWCPAPAVTADHEPPISVVGKAHLHLVPACAKCNFGRRSSDPKPGRSAEPSRTW